MTKLNLKKYTSRAMQGLTLVEVMIAMVVLSVGLLGLAGLQIHGLRGTSNANSRVQATFILSDIVERMHANPIAVNTNLLFQAVNLNANACAAPALNCDLNTSTCSTTQLAAHDNSQICQAMATNLPAGATLSITCPGCAANMPHTLILNWSEVRDASLGGNLARSITMTIQPYYSINI